MRDLHLTRTLSALVAAAHGCARPRATHALRATLLLPLCLAAACSARGEVRTQAARACLDAESGESAAHAALQRSQRGASATPNDANAWVTTGEVWLRVARTYARPELFSAADDCAERALGLEAHAPAALRLRAMSALNAHRFADARAIAQKLLDRDANDVLSWAITSDAELELGNLEAATEAVQQMLDREPGLAAYGRAAHLAWLRGERASAKRLYRAAIEAGRHLRDPEPRLWMLVQAAWVFWHEGDYAGARDGFALALKGLPEYAPALEGLGRAQLSAAASGSGRARADSASAGLAPGVQGQTPAPLGAAASAEVRGDRAGYVEAARTLERALAVHPLPETAWWLGDAYAALGDSTRAQAAYARVEALAERSDPRTLSLFYATQDRKHRAALRLAQRAYRERQDWYAKDALAFALYRNGKLREALPLARELLATSVPDARLLYHAGLILRAAGDAAVGGEAMRRALSINPRFDLRLTGALHDTTFASR